MRIQDLGELDGPVQIFGGPYSNLAAIRALIAEAMRRGIAPDHMICTGDVVAYCAEPAETVAEIRALGCPVVAGNCELQLAANQMDCGCGFAEGSACDLLSAGWFAYPDKRIGAPDRAWMGCLPDLITFSHLGRRCAALHGGITDVSRFLWETSPGNDFAREISLLWDVAGHVDLVFAGHSGLPFTRRIGDVLWINAGVIGLPPNDGAPQTRFTVLSAGGPAIHKLHYNHRAAHASMRAAGLKHGYDAALLSGLWPSEDVLPADLRRSALASG